MGAAALRNIWLSVPETPGSAKALRFQDKKIPAPLSLGVRLRLALDSKYFKHSLTCWVYVRQSELQNGAKEKVLTQYVATSLLLFPPTVLQSSLTDCSSLSLGPKHS